MVNLCRVFISACLSLSLTACIILETTPPVPEEVVQEKFASASTSQAMRQTSSIYAQAKASKLDFFAPSNFADAKMAMDRARILFREQADDMEIKKYLFLVEEHIQKAYEVKKVSQQNLHEVLAQIDVLTQKNAKSSYGEDYDYIVYRAQELSGQIEKNNSGDTSKRVPMSDIEKEKKEILEDAHKLEIAVVKHNTLTATTKVFKEVDAINGDKYAPQTYKEAELAFQRANEIIEKDVRNDEAIEKAGDDYRFAVHHAMHVARAAKHLDGIGGREYEQYILNLEKKLAPIAEARNYRDIRDHSIFEQTQILTGLAQRIKTAQSNNSVNAVSNNSSVTTATQDIELRRLKEEKQLAMEKIEKLTASVATLKQRIEEMSNNQSPLKQKMWAMEQQLSDLQLRNAELQHQSESLQSKLTQLQQK
ncbi:hypothetical protein [Kaarinaea lacus]